MSYTTLPTRGPTDLQAAITDVRAPTANELSADSIEAIKDRIIEIGTAVGIDAGTGSGSLRRGYLPTLLQLAGLLTPAQITANQDNYAPTGIADASVLVLSSDAARTITGIAAGQAAGRTLFLVNGGGFAITLGHSSGSSSAANRMALPGAADLVLGPGDGIAVYYSGTISRWYAVARYVAPASETVAGVVELATTAETQTGTDTARAVTPAGLAATSVPLGRTITTTAPLTIGGGASADLSANRTLAVSAASDTAAGVAELATTAETITGTDTARVVTPKGLADTLQPAGRSVSGTTDTIVAGDIGNVVLYSQAGGVEAELATLAGSLIAGRALVLTFQCTNAATVLTIDPDTGVTIDGSTSSFVAATGKSRVSLISLDGLAWYSGTP